MKSIKLCAALFVAAFAILPAATANAAAACSQACSARFNQCTAGGGTQYSCMNSWNQCRNTCNGVAAKPAQSAVPVKTPIKTASVKPKAPVNR